MIFVQEQPEPGDFAAKVRAPGQAFLRRNRNPNNQQFKKHRYWKEALVDLQNAYRGICAYSAHWIPSTIRGSVDHFVPKDSAPQLAYEWSNYRLCTDRMNSNKDNHHDVIDPFKIENGWFTIDFASFFVSAEDSLAADLKSAIGTTIDRLKLNEDGFVQERFELVQMYSNGDVSFDFLLRRYPFIASELIRQNLRDATKAKLKMP